MVASFCAVSWPVWSNGQSSDSRPLGQQLASRREIIRQSELAVLRQKVSLPLDRLVQPISLAEWRDAATITPLVTSPVGGESAAELPAPAIRAVVSEHAATPTATDDTSNNPFVDDPAQEGGGKIPSGKLMGIVGRALYESAPVPSLEGLREQLPDVPVPMPSPGGPSPAAADDPFGAESDFAPLDESDPFSEPAAAPAEAEGANESSSPEEDPFG